MLRAPISEPLRLAQTLGIDTARLSNWCKGVECDPASQIPAEELALVLGTRMADIGDLVKEGRLMPINTGRSTMHLWFDLRQIDRLLSRLSVNGPQEDDELQPLAKLANPDILKLFNADFSVVWDLVFTGAIRLYRAPSVSFFRSCQVNASDFFGALHERLVSQETAMTGKELANVTHISGESAKLLASMLFNNRTDYRPSHIMSKWISINRVCRFIPYRTNSLRRILHEAGYDPALETTSGQTAFFYEYSYSLYTLLSDLAEGKYTGYTPPASDIKHPPVPNAYTAPGRAVAKP